MVIEKMSEKAMAILFLLIFAGALSANTLLVNPPDTPKVVIDNNQSFSEETLLRKFSSAKEVKDYIKESRALLPEIRKNRADMEVVALAESRAPSGVLKSLSPSLSGDEAFDHSTTNVQVEGVDEGDIIKTDGQFIYILSGNNIKILRAYPPEEAQVLSVIRAKDDLRELYIYKDRLITLGNAFSKSFAPEVIEPIPSRAEQTVIRVYDVLDRSNPLLVKTSWVDGSYHNSRMIENHLYVIANQHGILYDDLLRTPEITTENKSSKVVYEPDIYYFDRPDYSYSFTNVVALDVLGDDSAAKGKTYLTGAGNNLYVSQDNIYIAQQARFYEPLPLKEGLDRDTERTLIHRIAIKDGDIRYEAQGELPGRLLNQFSMDEHNGYFRAATTTGHVSSRGGFTSSNHLFVLDKELDIVGSVEDLAPGERIYSVRFMGDRAYVVTFQKVDPLFVIDLKDPEEPRVLGKLKIPGYSDYLHPYDEDHIIGLGKDAVEAEQGNFAWYQGVKLALFDVSDVLRPKEISRVVIGDRGTDSEALHNHKAFLFSRDKNLLVIPIMLAEIDRDRYSGDLEPKAYGDFVWQGAFVYDLTVEDGFQLKGRISHDKSQERFQKSGRYIQGGSTAIRRSLYIENALYTMSESTLKINDLDDLRVIKEVRLN